MNTLLLAVSVIIFMYVFMGSVFAREWREDENKHRLHTRWYYLGLILVWLPLVVIAAICFVAVFLYAAKEKAEKFFSWMGQKV